MRVILSILLMAAPSWAAISRITQASAATTSVAISTPTAGDLILVCAYNNASTTSPTLVSGYTSIASNGANTNALRVAFKWSDGTETGTGTWTNATDVAAVVLRGAHWVGANVVNGGTGTSVTYSALTYQNGTSSTSWSVGCGANRTSATATAPTGMTAETNTSRLVLSDTEGTGNSFSSASVTGNTNTGWRSAVIEARVQTAPTTGTGVPQLYGYRTTAQNSTTNGSVYHIPLPNTSGSGNCIVIGFMGALGGSTLSTITDTAGNTYNSLKTFTGTSGQTYWLYEAHNITATNNKEVIITFSGATVIGFTASLMEFYNVATSSPSDGTATGQETGSGTAHNAGSITTISDGDVVVSFAFQVGAARWDGASIAPHGGFTLRSADLAYGAASQYAIQGTHAATNPQFYTLADQTWGVVTCALKSATAGTAPSAAIRVIGIQDYTVASVGSFTTQFPASGNLVVANWDGYNGGVNVDCTVSSITDNVGNTWTSRGNASQFASGTSGNPKYDESILDTAGAGSGTGSFVTAKVNQGLLLKFTLSTTSGGSTVQLLDIANAAAYDTVATSTGLNQSTTTWNTVSLTPAKTGLVIVGENQDIGTIRSGTGGSGYNFNSPWFPEENGGFNTFIEDRGTGHVNNTGSGSITFGFTSTANPGAWAAVAGAYSAVAAATKVVHRINNQ